MSTAQRVARNTASLAAVQGFRIVAALAITLYIARFGAAWLGKYALLLAYLNIFQILADFGLPRLVTREVARAPAAGNRYFWNALAAQLTLSAASMLLMLAAVALIGYPADTTRMLQVATLAIPPYALASVAGAMLQAHERMAALALAEGVSTLWQLVGSIWLLSAGYGVVALAWVRVVGVLLSGLVNLISMRRVTHPGRPAGSPHFALALAHGSLDLFILAAFGAILFRLDVLVLTEVAGEAATGVYNAAYQLAKVVALLSLAYADAIFPTLSRLYAAGETAEQTGNGQADWVLRKSFAWSAAVLLPLAVGATILPAPVIGLLYPQAEFAAAVTVLPWLGWMLLPYFAYVILNRALVAANLQRVARDTTVIMVLVGVGLQYGLARWQGVTGTAIATTLTFLLGAALNAFFVRRALGTLHLGRAFGRALPAALGLSAVLALLRAWPLWVSLPAGALSYAGLAFMTRAFTREDLALVRKMIGR